MKTRIIFGIGLAMAMSCSTGRESLDPAQVGSFDGMLNVCREINPAGISVYNTLAGAMSVSSRWCGRSPDPDAE